jgi:phenylacetate-CoA ligase
LLIHFLKLQVACIFPGHTLNLIKFFLRAPSPIRNFYFNWQGSRNFRQRYGGNFHSYLAEYEGNTFKPADEIRSYQLEKLDRFLTESVGPTPFYRSNPEYASLLQRRDILGDLSAAPVLNKDIVKQNRKHFINPVWRGSVIVDSTSGTTGHELTFPVTREADQRRWASWWRFRRWHGLDLGTPCAFFTVWSAAHPSRKKPPYWRYTPALKETRFSSFHLSAQTAPYYLAEIKKLGIPWLHGFPSVLSILEIGRAHV